MQSHERVMQLHMNVVQLSQVGNPIEICAEDHKDNGTTLMGCGVNAMGYGVAYIGWYPLPGSGGGVVVGRLNVAVQHRRRLVKRQAATKYVSAGVLEAQHMEGDMKWSTRRAIRGEP